jgi:Carbohydrate binding domain (family 11)
MKTLGRQLSTKRFSVPFATLACMCLPALSSCILQPRESGGAATPASADVKKKAKVAERWQAVGGGMLGVAADTKGSKGTWALDDGPKPGQRSLLIEYDLKPGGFVGAWHTTTNLNLAKADGLRFMAKADPPGMVMMSMTDANEVSYVTNFQIPSKEWTEIIVPLAVMDKNPNYQRPQAKQGNPVDWSRTTSLSFDARTDGQGKIWIGPVYIDEAK